MILSNLRQLMLAAQRERAEEGTSHSTGGNRRFTKEDKAWMLAHHKTKTSHEAGMHLGFSSNSITVKARSMGIKFHNAYLHRGKK